MNVLHVVSIYVVLKSIEISGVEPTESLALSVKRAIAALNPSSPLPPFLPLPPSLPLPFAPIHLPSCAGNFKVGEGGGGGGRRCT